VKPKLNPVLLSNPLLSNPVLLNPFLPRPNFLLLSNPLLTNPFLIESPPSKFFDWEGFSNPLSFDSASDAFTDNHTDSAHEETIDTSWLYTTAKEQDEDRARRRYHGAAIAIFEKGITRVKRVSYKRWITSIRIRIGTNILIKYMLKC
jgi:hypothetical protein